MKPLSSLLLSLVVGSSGLTAPETATPFPVKITVDAAQSLGPLKPIWRFFGADEPNYTHMKDGRKLLAEIGSLKPGEVYFRTHNLLTTGDGTPAHKWGSTNAYTEDSKGNPIYDWTIVDRIFDVGLARGVRPYVQIGFMPEAMSIKPQPYQHEWRAGLPYNDVYTGWTYPPKDYAKWGELVYQWAKHCVEKYGPGEVERWYWETWNEANIGYWSGTPEEFRKLHDYAIAGVRRALPTARVGGPDFAGHGGQLLRDFLEHSLRGTNHATGETGTPLDFIAFHAKGQPVFLNGHVRMGIANQLRTLDEGFAIIASFPELKAKPIVLGESDPEGCAACQGGQFTYRSGTVYSSYTAASFARKHDIAAKHGVNLEGALTWAFEFEDQPYFAGQRVLSTNGIALPVLNVFRMFSRMGSDRIRAESTSVVPLEAILKSGVRGDPDVGALASRDSNRLAVMMWHYHDDDIAGSDAAVEFLAQGLPAAVKTAKLTHYRIDETHSNAFAEWKRMGSPIAPNREQYAAMQKASELAGLAGSPSAVAIANGAVTLRFSLPRQGVSLVVLEWE